MRTGGIVNLAALGLCEHCGVLISLEDMPLDAMGAEWRCPQCEQVITGQSFGYNESHEKVRWVGKDKKWVENKPKEDFDLDGLTVVVNPRSPLHFA